MTTARNRIVLICDKTLEYVLYLLIFLIPFLKAGLEVCAAIILFLFLIKKIFVPDFVFLKDYPHIMLIIFFEFCILSLINSMEYRQLCLRALFGKWLKYILIFIVAEDILTSSTRIRNALRVFLLSGALIGLDALFQRIAGFDLVFHQVMKFNLITATFGNRNSLAVFLLPILILTAILCFYPQLKKQYRYALFSAVIFFGALLILSISRGAWIGFAAGIGLVLFLSWRSRKLFITASVILALFICLLLLLPDSRNRIKNIFIPGGDAYRIALSRASWSMIEENPWLGKGIGTYMKHFPHYYNKANPDIGLQYAHNCFLQIWAETGIFALLSFLLFTGSIIYKGIRAWLRDSNIVALALACAIFAFLIHSCFDNHLYSLPFAVMFWSMLGILSAVAKHQVNTSQNN